MKKKSSSQDINNSLFCEAMTGTRRLTQDTFFEYYPSPEKRLKMKKKHREARDNLEYQNFSDNYIALPDECPTQFLRKKSDPWILKRLRRGNFTPERYLDLHGLTQQQAKYMLGEFIAECHREKIFCVCIIHGHGKGILKKAIPLLLAQHPCVVAFHQAPENRGADAALWVLIE